VHPEAYPVVERILADLQRPVAVVMRDAATLKAIDPARYTSERFGLPTVRDILKELEKPGRDPREVVKAGGIVKVKVPEVDTKRRRVALSMKHDAPAQPQTASQQRIGLPGARGANDSAGGKKYPRARPANQGRSEPRRDDGALAEALQRALQSR